MARSRLSNVNITVQGGTFQDEPRVLMLGLGWFPATLGGLDRYYRSLFEQLPRAQGVVIGPADDAPGSLTVLARQDSPLPRRLLGYWLAARRALAQTDVIDAHFALYAAAPILLGARGGRPLVFHFHGPWAEEHAAAGGRSKLGLLTRRTLERAVLRRADTHVVLSSAFRRVLVERYGARPWDVRVWPPGVELDTFTPGDRGEVRGRLGVAPQSFLAVCVRRLVPRMGIEVLLDAWRQIAGELPEGSTLVLVGDGPLREQLAESARGKQLAGRVQVLGRVSDEELIDLYRAADVAVVPTLSVEGFGLVVLEAAACGTPSIVSNVGGLPEATRPLDPSLLVPPGDAAALGARLLESAQGRLPTRERTRRFAEGFSWPAVAERHRELYRELLGAEHARGADNPPSAPRGDEDEGPIAGRGRGLRVVYLDHIARLSGAEIALLRLLPHLRGVDAHVILGEHGPLAERLQEAGISVEVLPIAPAARDLRKDALGRGASPAVALQTLAYVVRLALRLRRLQPDIVHTNSLKAGVYGALAARAAGIPVVWHVRDRVAEDYLPKPAVRLVRALIRHLAGAVLANSEATLQTLSPRDLGRVHAVIPDSVEISSHAATTAGTATTFGMLGRIAPWKGQDLFLRAFAASFPRGTERAVVVGTPLFGEQSYEEELRRLAESLGIAERVEFRGFREDIWSELASFDVLVHASLIPEPFGQVVIEGMAAGLPVLAPDEGGPAAVILDRHNGRLFRSRDAKSLAAAMGELADDPLQRERLGSAAREAARDYHPDRLAGELGRFYDRVLRDG
jgi:glycosyltransferase involved in cell wall biosynthesis